MSFPLLDAIDVTIQRDQAMQQVSDHAEQHRPGFSELAMDFVLRYLADYGPTSGEIVTLACKANGIKAHDDRAMGSVYMKLARAGRIQKVGTAKRLRGHNTGGGNIWALAKEGETP